MGRIVRIPYKPREWAKTFHFSNKRWKVLVVHRRAGKTTAILNHLQLDAGRNPNALYGYIAPTYKQAKFIAWDLIKQYSFGIPDIVYNESELTVKYPNGSKLTLFGADNPDSLRGLGFWGVAFDEYSQQPSNIFTEVIRPALSDHQGYAIWVGTPKGKNELYRLYENGKHIPDWLSLLLTVKDTNLIPQTELEDARHTMSEDEFEQEFMCSFESSIKGAYYANELKKARDDKRIRIVPYDPMLKVHTVWDLGVGDSTSIGFWQLTGPEVRLIDFYEDSGKGLNHYFSILQTKGYVYGNHFAPQDIKVRELSTGKSRWEIAKDLGVEFQIVPSLSIDDGINAVRMLFPRLWINENLTHFLDCIGQYRKDWDELKGLFKDKPLHDWTSHAADMLRYTAIALNKLSIEPKKDLKAWKSQIKEFQKINEFG